MFLLCSAFIRWFVFSVVWHSSQSTLARDVMSVTVLCCATRVRYLLYCNFIGPILTLLTSNFIGPIHTSSISNFIGPWVQYHITSPIINSIGWCRIWATTCTCMLQHIHAVSMSPEACSVFRKLLSWMLHDWTSTEKGKVIWVYNAHDPLNV